MEIETKEKAKLIKTAQRSRIRLEKDGRGLRVVFVGKREMIFIDLSLLTEIVTDFNEIAEIKGLNPKPNGK